MGVFEGKYPPELFLGRVHQDGREGARHDHADDDREHRRPEQVGERQQQRERHGAQDREPDDLAAAEAVAQVAADQRSHRLGHQEQEQQHLRDLHRDREFPDQVEGVVGAQARRVGVLGEHQHEQDDERRR